MLPHELPNNLKVNIFAAGGAVAHTRKKKVRILGNEERLGKCENSIEW